MSSHTQDSPGSVRATTGTRPIVLQVLLMSILVVLLAVRCIGGQDTGDGVDVGGETVDVMFPQHYVAAADYWRERFVGKLTLEDGCLRASSLLLIWPASFTFDTKNGVVRVIDADGRIAAHAGDDVRFSRAHVSFEEARDGGRIDGLSEDCSGPYWLVGGEVVAIGPGEPANPPVIEGPEVHFPPHDAPLGTDNGGHYFAGRIVLDGECLRAEVPADLNSPASTWLLIWPDAFTLDTEHHAVRIVDETGRVTARVGDHIRISRATVSYEEAHNKGLVRGMSEKCEEPYLLVGDEVSAFDPNNEPTELQLSEPEVLFPRQKTDISVFRELLMAAGVGELRLDGQCLRLGDYTIKWPAGFEPHVENGVVQVRNGAGRTVAKVGDRIAGGGGYSSSGYGDCPGGTFGMHSIKVLPDVEVYFPKQDGTLGTDEGMERFTGNLIVEHRCLMVDEVVRLRDRVIMPGGRYLLVWPETFALDLDDEVAGIVDGTDRVVARVGDEVQFSAVSISYQEAMDHTGLREISPACSGGYWVVGEDFAAAAGSESE